MSALDNYIGETVMVHFSLSCDKDLNYLVEEKIVAKPDQSKAILVNSWGPVPTKEIAYQIVLDRKERLLDYFNYEKVE